MKFRFIQQRAKNYSVKGMCHALGVSRSGYYAWRRRPPSTRDLANQTLLRLIRLAYRGGRQTYGYRRVHAEVKKQMTCSRNRVARLMRQAGLWSRRRRRYRVTTRSRHKRPVAANHLARTFSAKGPNRKWVSDITYIHTGEGWLYLSTLMDLYSRKVIGWAMEPYLTDELTTKALEMALGRRQPPPGLVHHSDRGSQYASRKYQALLAQNNAVVSMSRTGNAYDNAPMESFFATLKMELIHRRRYRTRYEAKVDVFEYIEVFYNRQRLHSALKYRSPEEFEMLGISP